MRARLYPVWLALAAQLVAQPAQSEPTGSYFEITPFGGFTIFDGDFRFPGSLPLTDDLHIGGRLGYQWNRWLGLELAAGFTPTSEDISGGEDVDFLQGSAAFTVTPWSGRYGGPFLILGGGGSRFKASGGGVDLDQGNLELGLGIRLWLTDAIGFRLEGRNLSWLPKEDITNPLTNTVILGGGISFALGGTPRDSDMDGVPDRKDQCPDTPRGARVDANGCPIDSDQDKVFDGLDQCANTPQGCTVDAKGCPSDADGDAVCDGLDQCADTPRGASVDAKGCPSDSDGDGVPNGLDQCEGTPQGAQVDPQGCPRDGDGDGVADGLDKCPDTTPGLKVDKDGCPIELIERETELMDTGMIRLQNVNFETAKWDILPESRPVLDVVGQVLSRWPELRIEVGGHADWRGSDAYNLRLSQRRVDAVLGYLLEKFPTLKREQYTAKGYGESRPIATNKTVEGMARNRRVEFVVLNKDVLKREVERRRLLKSSETTPAPAPVPLDTIPRAPAAPDTTRR